MSPRGLFPQYTLRVKDYIAVQMRTSRKGSLQNAGKLGEGALGKSGWGIDLLHADGVAFERKAISTVWVDNPLTNHLYSNDLRDVPSLRHGRLGILTGLSPLCHSLVENFGVYKRRQSILLLEELPLGTLATLGRSEEQHYHGAAADRRNSQELEEGGLLVGPGLGSNVRFNFKSVHVASTSRGSGFRID